MAESIIPTSFSFVNVLLVLLWWISALLWGHSTEQDWKPTERTQHRVCYLVVIQTPTASFSAFPSKSCLVTPVRYPEAVIVSLHQDSQSLGNGEKPCRHLRLNQRKRPSSLEWGVWDRSCPTWCSTVLQNRAGQTDSADKVISFGSLHFTSHKRLWQLL